jgi:hypothetical protein
LELILTGVRYLRGTLMVKTSSDVITVPPE